MRFKTTFCSQCGQAFGPGDQGYSHCQDHQVMENVTFTRAVKAQVNLTADQWQLFTASMDCTEAAESLNRMAEIAIASSSNSREAMRRMANTINKYSDFGAADSEPIYVMRRLFAEAYGQE